MILRQKGIHLIIPFTEPHVSSKQSVNSLSGVEAHSQEYPQLTTEVLAGLRNSMGDSYSTLLDRVYKTHEETTAIMSDGKLHFKPPVIHREGSRKSIWINFLDFQNPINRPIQHIIMFFANELGTIITLSKDNSLIIRGIFNQGQIKSIIKKYIHKYVKCKSCGKYETDFLTENRINYTKCRICLSKISTREFDDKHVFLSKTAFNKGKKID